MTEKMLITSSAFPNNGDIPVKYTCEGQNISPPLEINGVPPEAKTLALIMDDPDAPHGVWDHWIIWNLSPHAGGIEEGTAPGDVGRGSNGESSYSGPCPPSGTHRYFFKAYALDNHLSLPPNAGKKELIEAMIGHILAHGELIGLYKKKSVAKVAGASKTSH